MKVLFDITHPVNVHFFKHAIGELKAAGHQMLVVARDKDVTLELLRSTGIDFVCISRQGRTKLGMAAELAARNWRLARLARRFGADVMVAAEAGVSVGPVGAMLRIPQVIFDQVDRAPLQQLVGLTFARRIVTGESYIGQYGKRHVRFRGVLAQSYLDPRRFRADPAPLVAAGVDPAKPLIVMRLVRWGASHDVGRKGLGVGELQRAVEELSRFGRVLISSEQPLPQGLAHCRNPVPARHLHDLLAHSRLCLAEGGTVSVEAGLLGVPAICCNTYDFGYLLSLERDFGIIRRTNSLADAMAMAIEILDDAGSLATWRSRRDSLFARTDDVAEFMLRMILETGGSPATAQGGRV